MTNVTQFKNAPKGMTLVQMAQELERQRTAKRDFVANTRDLSVEPTDNGLALKVGTVDQFPLQQHALRQIGTRLDIPAKYVDRLAQKHPDMLAYNINKLFEREPEDRMVRTLDGKARAFLSNAYRTDLDNSDFANAVLPILIRTGCTVTSCQITETRLYIKAFRPDVIRQIDPSGGDAHLGDGQHNRIHVFRPGLMLSNSEVGAGAVALDGGIREDGCSNLMIFSTTSMRRFHIGVKQDVSEGWELLSAQTQKLTSAAVWAGVTDLVKANIENLDLFNRMVEECEAKMKGVEIAKPTAAIRELPNTSESEQEGILAKLIKGGDLSQFGLQAAITEFAQDPSVSYERQVELERLGGSIIELPKTEWEELAQAA